MSEDPTGSTGRSVLFLDIDGVLNDAQPIEALPESNREWVALIDEQRVALLDAILEATGAEVVLSSSWRQVHTLSEMQEILEMAGFQGLLVDQTPVIEKARGEQIQAWLHDHRDEVDRYVALDDSPYMSPLSIAHIVKTSGERGGMTEREKDEAIEKLEAQ